MNQLKHKTRIRTPAIFLGLYFVLLPFDCFPIEGIGSLLRIFAVLPILLAFLDGGCRKMYLNTTTCCLAIYVVFTFFSIAYTLSDIHTEKELKTLIMNAAMIIVVGACYEYESREIKWLKKCLIAGSWLTAVLMMVMGHYVSGRLVLSLGGYLQDANYVNGYMLFAYSYHLGETLKKKSIAHALATLLLLLLVLATGSRGALLAYAGCTFLQLYFSIIDSKKKWNNILWILVMLIMAVVVMSAVLPMIDERVTKRFSIEYLVENGTTGRSDVWKYLVDYYGNSSLERQFFGYGYGTTTVLTGIGEVAIRGKVAHNLYIDLLLNIGLIGLTVFLVLQISCLRSHMGRRKDGLAAVHASYLTMCLSLSLLSYKPLWATMIMGIIADSYEASCINNERILS